MKKMQMHIRTALVLASLAASALAATRYGNSRKALIAAPVIAKSIAMATRHTRMPFRFA
jgi:hypothetical protein